MIAIAVSLIALEVAAIVWFIGANPVRQEGAPPAPPAPASAGT